MAALASTVEGETNSGPSSTALFSRFDTIPEFDRHTQTHDDGRTAIGIASRGKNCRM